MIRLSGINLSTDLNINLFWDQINSIKNGLNERTYGNLANFVFNLLSLPCSFAVAKHNFFFTFLNKN